MDGCHNIAGSRELRPLTLYNPYPYPYPTPNQAFPLKPPALQERSSLDLSKVIDLTQLGRDASPAGRLSRAAPVVVPAGMALPAAGADTAETVETAAVPMQVEAVSVCAQPVRLQSVNLLSGLLPSSLLPRTLAKSAPSTPLSGQLSYLVAVPTPLGAATAQAAPLPAAAAAEVRKGWTELEDEEILRRHEPRATRHTPQITRHTLHATHHTPHATRHAP